MRDHLEGTVQAFNASVGSVERSFLVRARKLKELNAGGDESILRVEPVDERLRILEAPELNDEFFQASLIEGVVLTPVDHKS
jgi:hypothetical protein